MLEIKLSQQKKYNSVWAKEGFSFTHKNMGFLLSGPAGTHYMDVCVVDIANKTAAGKYPIIASLSMSKQRSSKAYIYKVDYTAVSRQYQGFGVASKIYELIMQKANICLKSGDLQSPGGQRIWFDLFMVPCVRVVGSLNNGKVIEELSQDEIGSRLEAGSGGRRIYENERYNLFASVE